VPNMNDNKASAREYSTSTTCVLSQSRSPSHVQYPPVLITDRGFAKILDWHFLADQIAHLLFSVAISRWSTLPSQTDRYSDAQKVALTQYPNPFNSRIRNNRTMTEIDAGKSVIETVLHGARDMSNSP